MNNPPNCEQWAKPERYRTQFLKPKLNKMYEMFTKAGDKACDGLVRRAKRKILGKKRVTEEEMYRFAYAGMRKIAARHPEVDDTEPRYHISRGINACLKDAGYGFRIQFSF